MAAKSTIRSEGGKVRRVVVVGGGLAGLMTVIKLCEAKVPVDLISLVPVKRSHSVCAQGGINASVNTKGEGDSPQIHLEETAYGGDFLANQPPVKGMAEAAPGIVFMLDRMGVPFNRTPEGLLDFRRFGGTLFHRTAFAGATTGQQLLYALDEQVRRFEIADVVDEHGVAIPGEKMVRKFEFWDFLQAVLDDSGTCVGCIAQDLKTMQIRYFQGDAVVLATGGCGIIFGRSTMSVICTGTAAAAVYQQGAVYANGEFIQVHPTAIPGADKLRLISESARGEGGRVWVPKDPKDAREPREIPEKERDYVLERMYPGYGNLVPRDIASRAIFKTCFHEKRGVFNPKTGRNENEVYLDLTHKDEKFLRAKLAGILEIYEKFAGVDPYHNPMKVFPAVHYSMGGLWVDFERDARGSLKPGSPRNHATSIPGLYAVGEVDYQYHGANRLGANSLLSCIYGGMVTGPSVASYQKSLAKSAYDLPKSIFEKAEKRARDDYERILKQNQDKAGAENAYRLHDELGNTMLRDCTIERDNGTLEKVLDKISELDERVKNVKCTDLLQRSNMGAQFVRHLENMLVLARVIAQGAKNRDESRGAHYKPGFPKRNDADWLRTTLATHTGKGNVRYVREFDYVCAGQTVHVTDAVDTSLVMPRERKYEQAGAASAAATGKLAATPPMPQAISQENPEQQQKSI
ncbi:succinate dehydrogenase flavoprotein subunit [Polyangium aurulentum]|uniref:succinate dehydrogenase flavoprotein subunit n=1 Tax=Polyangium aurulentum TaxID=2567896 RepID=UPI0010AE35A2|nr:succinate dehydrogenase flavoprotein subunit [Polyangium aurulentum]UQA61290.1 succinate dehydrogenase flavoprotein subunit [Polyangium aurulentum]